MSKRIGFTGTKRLPAVAPDRVELFVSAVQHFVAAGAVIQSTPAEGADRLAVETALEAGGAVHLYLPWDTYEHAWLKRMQYSHRGQVEVTVFSPEEHAAWIRSAAELHPQGQFLSNAALKLIGASHGAILASTEVVILPAVRVVPLPTKSGVSSWFGSRSAVPEAPPIQKGSAELALRLARARNMRFWDLSEDAARSALLAEIGEASDTFALR